ncbi:MAG: MFS transporter [Solirubrobacteraceae bacterium]
MRSSLLGYRRLARAPGVPRLTTAFLALRTSGTMAPVSLVLFAREVTGSFATASGVLAAVTAGGLVLGPARGRLVDRVGPSPAVLMLALPSVATDGLFIVVGHSGAGADALIALGALSGAVTAPAGTALRSVWSDALADAEGRHTAYALMGVVQETNFIVGPLLAGLLIAVFSATVAVAAAAVLNLIGGLLFATSRQARARPGRPPVPGRLPALRGPGIRIVLAAAAGFGATFGLLDVTLPAVAHGHGAAAAAGILLSAFAAGSLAGGLMYGRGPVPAPQGSAIRAPAGSLPPDSSRSCSYPA